MTPKPGELWRTRDGRKAFIVDEVGGSYPLFGAIEGSHVTRFWADNGRDHVQGKKHPEDLIAPWPESKPGFVLKWFSVGETIPAGSRFTGESTEFESGPQITPNGLNVFHKVKYFLYEVPCD